MTRLGLDAVWNTFSNVCHHIHMSNLVWKHLHWSVSSVFRSESRMISNDWYTSFLRSVGILDYDRLACSQKRKCLVILTTILLFSVIPCFVYHSLLTKAKPEAVKSQTSKNTRSFKQIKMNLTTKRPKTGTWDRQLQTCRQHNSNSNKTSCYHKAHYSKDNFPVLGATFDLFKEQSAFQAI